MDRRACTARTDGDGGATDGTLAASPRRRRGCGGVKGVYGRLDQGANVQVSLPRGADVIPASDPPTPSCAQRILHRILSRLAAVVAPIVQFYYAIPRWTSEPAMVAYAGGVQAGEQGALGRPVPLSALGLTQITNGRNAAQRGFHPPENLVLTGARFHRRYENVAGGVIGTRFLQG